MSNLKIIIDRVVLRSYRTDLTFVTVDARQSGQTETGVSTARQRLASGSEATGLGGTSHIVVARIACKHV